MDPVTVHDASSSASPAISSRGEHLLASIPSAFETPSIPLSTQQLNFCQEAFSGLRQKLNASECDIDREFDTLCSDKVQVNKMMACTNVGRLECNLPKNRYLALVPYDDTRVLIKDADGQSSYINASYVVDSARENFPTLIATQRPLPNTIQDFWEMVVQLQCSVIVMLSSLRDQKMVNFGNYFPAQVQESVSHGRFRITNTFMTESENSVCYRLLQIELLQPDGSGPVPVLHLQFDWPDFGVPSSTVSVREIFGTVYKLPQNWGPLVVHCSAGVGRTGTFCAIYHTLWRILHGDISAVDLEQTVHRLRQQRFGMVETRVQYAFCYRAVVAELRDLISRYGATQ